MRTSVSAKRCPHCHRVTPLSSPTCAGCGHVFRTRFQTPSDFPAPPPALLLPASVPARPTRRGWLLFGLAALAAAMTLAIILVRPPRAPLPQSAPLPTLLSSEALYARIGLSQSLTEVTRTAGGLGRVQRSSDPHLLTLRYDGPASKTLGEKTLGENVRVVLERTNLAGNDYRVQTVALYQGETRVKSRSGE